MNAFPIPREQDIQQVLAYVKVRRLERGKCRCEVDQPALCGAIENTEGTCDLDPPRAGHGNPGAIVHQQKVGLNRGGERDGCPFAIVEGCECSVRSCRSGHDSEPAGRRGDPRPNGGQ